MIPDISLRTAHALQIQGKRLLSPMDSRALVGLLGAVLLAMEEGGFVRIEPAEPAHHGKILSRQAPDAPHLRLFYERAKDRSMLDFFESCTAAEERLHKEKEAFTAALEDAETAEWNRAHLQRLMDGETGDTALFSLLEYSDASRALFPGPIHALLSEAGDEEPRKWMEALPLLWMLRFVQ